MRNEMNPWAGLSAYQDGDARQFCGRDNESYDVAHLIDNNIFVTLYGKSGIGKSSLLQAGVFPRLRKLGYMPVPVRLGIEAAGQSLVACLCAKLMETLEQTGGRRIESAAVRVAGDESDESWLWSFFARSVFQDAEGNTLFPVLILDQFEEILRTRPRDAGQLLRQIHYMKDETHALPDTEEYHYDFNFRFLVSIREDELYRLEDCIDAHYLADMKSCRYRLCGLTQQGALEVVTLPGSECIDPSGAAEIAARLVEIAKNPEDGGISTNILSLLCSRTYDEMVRRGAPHIDMPLVEAVVSENPFEKYYLEAVSGLPKKARAYIEDHLVDGDERRNSVPEGDFFKKVPDGEVLIEDGPRKILQRVSVASGSNQTRIELVHDSFCAPLTNLRNRRRRSRRSFLAVGFAALALLIAVVSFGIIHTLRQREEALKERQWKMLENQSRYAAEIAIRLADDGDALMAKRLVAAILPEDVVHPTDRPYVPRAEEAFWQAYYHNGVVLRGHESATSFVSYCPDGQHIVSGARDGNIRLWDTDTGELVRMLEIPNYRSAALSPDGKYLAVSAYDGYDGGNLFSLCIWDFQNQKPLRELGLFNEPADDLFFTHDGKRLIYAWYGGIKMLDSETGELIYTVKDTGSGTSWRDISYNPVARQIAVSVYVKGEPGIRIYDEETGSLLHAFDDYLYSSTCLAFIPDESSTLLVWDSSLRLIQILNGETGELLGSFDAPSERIQTIALSPDCNKIAFGIYDGTVRIMDTENTNPARMLETSAFSDSRMGALAYSMDGQLIISASIYDAHVKFWDVATGKLLKEQVVSIPLDGVLRAVAVCPNGRYLASSVGEMDSVITVYDLETGDKLIDFKEEENIVTALAFSYDGRQIVSGSWYNIRIWDTMTGELLQEIKPDDSLLVQAVAFGSDGHTIVVGSRDYSISIWDWPSGSLIRQIKGRGQSVWSVALSFDGKYIASALSDSICLWDSSTGELVRTMESDAWQLVAFSPDGKNLVSGFADNQFLIWDNSLQDKLNEVRQKYPPLSAEERRQFYLE